VFYVYDNGQHGLIAAFADQSTGKQWYNGTHKSTGVTGDGLYAGAMNTAIIVAAQMADAPWDSFAAKVCADYSLIIGGITYGDWYLPSKHELNLMYQNIGPGNALGLGNVGGFASQYYWSSTEDDYLSAWRQNFYNGFQDLLNKSTLIYVRSVRAF